MTRKSERVPANTYSRSRLLSGKLKLVVRTPTLPLWNMGMKPKKPLPGWKPMSIGPYSARSRFRPGAMNDSSSVSTVSENCPTRNGELPVMLYLLMSKWASKIAPGAPTVPFLPFDTTQALISSFTRNTAGSSMFGTSWRSVTVRNLSGGRASSSVSMVAM